MIRVLFVFCLACSSSHQTTQAPAKQTVPTKETWKINDTFFYRLDKSFLQYPRSVENISYCWFNKNPFIVWVKPDTTSELICDTTIEEWEDYDPDTLIECEYSREIVLRSISAIKTDFHYSQIK